MGDDEEIEISNEDINKEIEKSTNQNKSKLINTSSNESSNTTSIDSGNCGVSLNGHLSESDDNIDVNNNKIDENSKQPLLKRESKQEIIIVNNKISTIFREPEGPGSNPEMNGFSFKRSQ